MALNLIARVSASLVGLVVIVTLPVAAASPVWKVEKSGTRLYLGGTMHVLTEADYPLPKAFDAAYADAQRIVFETDIGKMEDPAFQQKMLRELSFTDGRSLRQVVSPETYTALQAFFGARGVPMATVDPFKPGMVTMLMTMVEMQRLGITAVGVDGHFHRRAREDGKPTGELESVDQQIQFIARLGEGEEDAMLTYNLEDIERLPEIWRDMSTAWRQGDLDWLEAELAQPMRDDFPAVYESLMVRRNRAWIPQIEAMAANAEVEFVLVGALHLSGPDGLLLQLEQRGYRIRQLR